MAGFIIFQSKKDAALHMRCEKAFLFQVNGMIAMQQNALKSTETLGMTFYEMARPDDSETGIFESIKTRLISGIYAMQYARMREAMRQLSDDQLAQIGLERSGINAHAHKCIYGH